MNVIEVIALYGGLGDRGKSDNIRLIRGELNNPEVQIINLSTIEGMKEASLDVQPNDIIYIESLKPRASERVRDVLPFISLTSSILTFIVLIGTLL